MGKTQRLNLGLNAVASALRTRMELGTSLADAISPLDAAERLGIDVRLVDLPSMEGMYVVGHAPQILLSVLRPMGRRSFSCAHELGHHKFGHGMQYDELVTQKSDARRSDPIEFVADCFAAFFLMPKATVDSGLQRRGLKYDALTPSDVFALASWLGVGYATLVNHLRLGLNTISPDTVESLGHVSPREIRQSIAGKDCEHNLHIVDRCWTGRAVDCEVGDSIILPNETRLEGKQLAFVRSVDSGQLFIAKSSGIARATSNSDDWSAFVRVSPRAFVGRSCYRFEEEVEDDYTAG